MGDDMQLGQTEVCTDTKPPAGLSGHRHGHTHSAAHNHGHNHQHLHGVLIGTMQGYGNNLIETFKTETLCQVQCMDCQKVTCLFLLTELEIAYVLWIMTFFLNTKLFCVPRFFLLWPNTKQYFSNEEQMTAHRMVHHAQTNNHTATTNTSTAEKIYECDVCMKTFNKHSSWWKHKKCHTGERAYKCYVCEKSFTQQANLHRVKWTTKKCKH